MCSKHSQSPSQRCMASAALLSLICGQACSSETGIFQGHWALVGISSGLELSQWQLRLLLFSKKSPCSAFNPCRPLNVSSETPHK